jgi:hypothetical protein
MVLWHGSHFGKDPRQLEAARGRAPPGGERLTAEAPSTQRGRSRNQIDCLRLTAGRAGVSGVGGRGLANGSRRSPYQQRRHCAASWAGGRGSEWRRHPCGCAAAGEPGPDRWSSPARQKDPAVVRKPGERGCARKECLEGAHQGGNGPPESKLSEMHDTRAGRLRRGIIQVLRQTGRAGVLGAGDWQTHLRDFGGRVLHIFVRNR